MCSWQVPAAAGRSCCGTWQPAWFTAGVPVLGAFRALLCTWRVLHWGAPASAGVEGAGPSIIPCWWITG